jgi:hypothetical protein
VTTRRAALAALATLATGCAGHDLFTADRGAFAIGFEKLMTTGLLLLSHAIDGMTKKRDEAKKAELVGYRSSLLDFQKQVEAAIIAAPSQRQQLAMTGISDILDTLGKALPILLPLLAAA